jgi:hypothetical protein
MHAEQYALVIICRMIIDHLREHEDYLPEEDVIQTAQKVLDRVNKNNLTVLMFEHLNQLAGEETKRAVKAWVDDDGDTYLLDDVDDD